MGLLSKILEPVAKPLVRAGLTAVLSAGLTFSQIGCKEETSEKKDKISSEESEKIEESETAKETPSETKKVIPEEWKDIDISKIYIQDIDYCKEWTADFIYVDDYCPETKQILLSARSKDGKYYIMLTDTDFSTPRKIRTSDSLERGKFLSSNRIVVWKNISSHLLFDFEDYTKKQNEVREINLKTLEEKVRNYEGHPSFYNANVTYKENKFGKIEGLRLEMKCKSCNKIYWEIPRGDYPIEQPINEKEFIESNPFSVTWCPECKKRTVFPTGKPPEMKDEEICTLYSPVMNGIDLSNSIAEKLPSQIGKGFLDKDLSDISGILRPSPDMKKIAVELIYGHIVLLSGKELVRHMDNGELWIYDLTKRTIKKITECTREDNWLILKGEERISSNPRWSVNSQFLFYPQFRESEEHRLIGIVDLKGNKKELPIIKKDLYSPSVPLIISPKEAIGSGHVPNLEGRVLVKYTFGYEL